MNQSKQKQLMVAFQKLRNQYSQKIVDSESKCSILTTWIKQTHLTDFHELYKVQSGLTRDKFPVKNQKVLDTNDKNPQIIKIDEKKFEKGLQEAIKIIVQAYQKNQSVREKYSFENVEQMTEKCKITLKELLKIKSEEENTIKNKESNPKPQQNKKIGQVKTDIAHDNKIQPQPQANSKPLNENIRSSVQSTSKPALQQPKSNSLFVQKQAPISQQNIFKGQNNSRRPSSKLQNQKPQQLMGQKPHSSTKSNRSKRSRSSKSPNVEKSQKLQQNERKLEVQEDTEKILNGKNTNAQLSVQEGDKSQNEQVENQQSEEQNQNVSQRDQFDEIKETQDDRNHKKQIQFNQNDHNFHLPCFRLSNERPIQRKNPVDSILSNPYIKKAFNHLCKQSYIGGGKTFDQIAQSADIMTLNKWMVFCKQFDFVSKLKKKQLVDIFQQCAQNKPHINQKQFLNCLIIVQNKLKVDEEDFIRKHICLDSEFAFRQKLATFKVSYAGSKINFFEESAIKPLDKYYQSLREEKYQNQKQKQKLIILHQGKFKQDIESELLERKNQRNIRKFQFLNSSLTEHQNESSIDKKTFENRVKSPYLKFVQNKSKIHDNYSSVKNNCELELSKLNLSRRIQPLTYSQLFSQKNSISTKAFTNDKSIVDSNSRQDISRDHNLTQIKSSGNSVKPNEKTNTQSQASKTHAKKQSQKMNEKSSGKTTQKKLQKAQETKPRRQWVEQIKNWAEELDKSESEESDDILREHLMNEKVKKRNLQQKMDLSRMAQEFRKDEKWLQHSDLDDQSEWQKQTQLQTTSKKQRFK